MAKKKLNKVPEGTAILITVLEGELGEVRYDFNDLPEDIKAKLGPFGLSHKLGDAAAGKAGKEAEEAIQKVWKGLQEGDWSVRAPAAPKVSTKEIASNLESLPEEEKNKALEVLKSLGITLPGITNTPSEDEDDEGEDEDDDRASDLE